MVIHSWGLFDDGGLAVWARWAHAPDTDRLPTTANTARPVPAPLADGQFELRPRRPAGGHQHPALAQTAVRTAAAHPVVVRTAAPRARPVRAPAVQTRRGEVVGDRDPVVRRCAVAAAGPRVPAGWLSAVQVMAIRGQDLRPAVLWSSAIPGPAPALAIRALAGWIPDTLPSPPLVRHSGAHVCPSRALAAHPPTRAKATGAGATRLATAGALPADVPTLPPAISNASAAPVTHLRTSTTASATGRVAHPAAAKPPSIGADRARRPRVPDRDQPEPRSSRRPRPGSVHCRPNKPDVASHPLRDGHSASHPFRQRLGRT